MQKEDTREEYSNSGFTVGFKKLAQLRLLAANLGKIFVKLKADGLNSINVIFFLFHFLSQSA